MITRLRDLELIEQAQRETPTCVCGSATIPVARPDGTWLACSALGQPKSILRRLLSVELAIGHTQQRIVEAWPTAT